MKRAGALGYSKLIILGQWVSKIGVGWSLFITIHRLDPSLLLLIDVLWDGKGTERDVFGKCSPAENHYSIRL